MWHIFLSEEVLIVTRNLYTALPPYRAIVVFRSGIVHHTAVYGQVVVMESGIHGAVGSACPYAILVLVEHRTASTAKTEAYNNRLGIRSYDAESGIALGVDHRVLLSGLVQCRRAEVFLHHGIVKSRIEISQGIIYLLVFKVSVNWQRIVVYTYP